MMSRALPLLLLFVTFLFINAEVWQVTSRQDGGELWLIVLLFSVLAVAFLLVRLPEEVDRTDDDVDDAFLLDACRGHARSSRCSRELVDDPDSDPASYAEVTGYECGNLVMVLVIIQVVQVLLLAVTVFVFFLVFGALVMTNDVVEAWIGESAHAWRYLPNLTVELVQVSIFLAAFSGLYLTVSTVTDETYRAQFFAAVQRQIERAVGVRAVYLALREREGTTSDPASA